ncbi:SRPBCC domain-containing protein [Ornithinimicrobium sp. F0845]|uniref:SRPBCC family protein n=1 Tax=Ornithinimicrobium sp. F0845 TaxID=2926412 RepID=UPI001FF561F8|nr:SRPBCC family protein [Ornithinimicrobium sp. F0845]MCK0110748.1 SRPBCC domain-containing protein [Ornithinimicrobium sp. F0845]
MTRELVITQHVPAPPHQVYAAWLTPEGMSRWWWVSIGDTQYAVDGRVGGDYLVESVGAGIGVRGTFTRLEEPTLIELTWTWLDGAVAGPEEHVRVELADQDGGTLVTVTHLVATADGVESYRQGWEYVLGNLARLPHDGQLPSGAPAVAASPADADLQPAITLTQVVPAPRADTFAAWLEPERLAQWWWPGQDTSYVIDARRGGHFAIRSAQTGLGATGTYLELDEGERIVMTWLWESPGPAAPQDLVTVTFADGDDGQASTLVTLVHEFAVPQADTTDPTHGWMAVLDSLVEHLP